MLHKTKAEDKRAWAKWRASGAVGNIYDNEEKRSARRHFRKYLLHSGNLSRPEVRQLVTYEFDQGAESVDDQVARYYLKLKADKPKAAERMLSDVQPILSKGIGSEADVESLCRAIHTYWSGFLIRYGGNAYSVHNDKFGRTEDIAQKI
jgi:hypothetical protein